MLKHFEWARYSENGYECSTRGDRKLSALCAKLRDGRTIEEAYQLDVKGYRKYGNDWRLGKGKPAINGKTHEQLWNEYFELWRTYVKENGDYFIDLVKREQGKTFTDMFASTDISQARAIAIMCNRIVDELNKIREV